MILPPPKGFGLPNKFSDWRNNQEKAILHLQESDKRVVAQAQPTGSGKSLCYITGGLLTGRTLVLTSTKGLQMQLSEDFEKKPGLSIVMGKNAYACKMVKNHSCEWGICSFGKRCHLRKECHYYLAIERAKKAQIVVTNYSFWVCNKPDVLGEFDLLVCDEAHDSVIKLCDSLSVEVSFKEIQKCHLDWMERDEEKELWGWALRLHKTIKERIKNNLKDSTLENLLRSEAFKSLHRLKTRLDRLEVTQEDLWVAEHLGSSIVFDPLWPSDFTEECLFREVKKILLTSATITRKTIKLLGVEDGDLDFIEYKSHFPIRRRPVYWIPTCRVDYRMKEYDVGLWLTRINQIINRRLDRKGIIHTVSYDRCQRILHTSEYSPFMHSHRSGRRDQVIREFKESDPPAILVSPAVVAGYDFSYEQCEYQIIGKIPFPDQRRKVDKKRREVDPEFGIHSAAQNLVQAVGRGMRAEDDQCETFIIDDHVGWFIRKYSQFLPQSFIEAYGKAGVIPKPLEKL